MKNVHDFINASLTEVNNLALTDSQKIEILRKAVNLLLNLYMEECTGEEPSEENVDWP